MAGGGKRRQRKIENGKCKDAIHRVSWKDRFCLTGTSKRPQHIMFNLDKFIFIAENLFEE